MAAILTPAPFTNALGISDNSTQVVPSVAEAVPTHLPFLYLWAQKGQTTPQLRFGASLQNYYGSKTFDPKGPYYNHATAFAQLFNSNANAIMVQRLVPADAPKPAGVRISIDVLPTNVPTYKRNPDGSLQLDAGGDPIPTGSTVAGFKVRWISGAIPNDATGADQFGKGTQSVGSQTDAGTGTQSTVYPIFDFQASSQGDWGNNQAIRLYAPVANSAIPVSASLISTQMVYPLRVQFLARSTQYASPTVQPTINGAPYVDVALQPGCVDNTTDSRMYVQDVLMQAFNSTDTTGGMPIIEGPFGRMSTYQANIDTLLKQFTAAEVPVITPFSDLTGAANEFYRFNMFGGVSSQNVPYQSFIIDNSVANTLRFTENSLVYAVGGGDGTMTDAAFDAAVATAIMDWTNPAAVVQDTAKYPASYFYDTGFTVPTKKLLPNFIGLRKDTYVVLGTHTVGQDALTLAQESSLTASLNTALQAFPESAFHGTPTVRGTVVSRSGNLIGSLYTNRLPLTYEWANITSKCMGASDGRWKSDFPMDIYPNTALTLMKDINVTFTPATVRNSDWRAGMVWVEYLDTQTLYFTSLRTVYSKDTSVLTSFMTAAACVELQKVFDRVRREFGSRSDLSKEQYAERVDEEIVNRTNGRFMERFVIKSKTYFTAQDDARGYSFTTDITIYANSMRTVGTLSIISRRKEDLNTNQA